MAKTLAALIVSLCIAFSAAAAEVPAKGKKPRKYDWTELTAPQQQVLGPLQAEWEQLDATRRRKWIAIADRYPTMKPQEQERLQQRMHEWAKLSPAERRVARERYQTLKKLPPDKRAEVIQRWQEEQSKAAPAAPTPAPTPAASESPPGG